MKNNHLLKVCLISSGLVILNQIFQWQIIEIVTPFVMPFIWLVVFGFFLTMTMGALIALFKSRDLKPILIQIATILICVYVPFTQIMLNIDFKLNKAGREVVVKLVESGQIKTNPSNNHPIVHLPDQYEHLSKGGGDIMLQKKGEKYSVFFFTFRGILDNFSGFVYSPNGGQPSLDDFGEDFKQIKKFDENWYFVASS